MSGGKMDGWGPYNPYSGYGEVTLWDTQALLRAGVQCIDWSYKHLHHFLEEVAMLLTEAFKTTFRSHHSTYWSRSIRAEQGP